MSTNEAGDMDLERLAMEELIKESKRGKEREKTMGSLGWQNCPLPKTNKVFLRNMLASSARGQARPHKQRKVENLPDSLRVDTKKCKEFSQGHVHNGIRYRASKEYRETDSRRTKHKTSTETEERISGSNDELKNSVKYKQKQHDSKKDYFNKQSRKHSRSSLRKVDSEKQDSDLDKQSSKKHRKYNN